VPHTSYEGTVEASFDRVSTLLEDKMERPRKYIPGILHSTVLERGPGFLVREYYEPAPKDLLVRERITRQVLPQGEEYIYEHVDSPSYTGTFRNVLIREPGRSDRVRLAYAMDWKPVPGGAEKISDEEAGQVVERGVRRLASLAEHEVVVPEQVRAFYCAVDSLDSDALGPLLTPDCTFRVGNRPPITGRDHVVEGNRMVTARFTALSHDYVEVRTAGDAIYAECWVDYTMKTGANYLLPFLTAFQLRDGLIAEIKIFGDMSPLRYGWPGEPG